MLEIGCLKPLMSTMGLRTSFEKCVAFPIACADLNLDEILLGFGGSKGVFPCHYLGFPLSLRRPRRVEVQPLFDRVFGKLKGWKGRLLSRKGRLELVNTIITATATYFLIVFPADSWLMKKLDKIRRSFLWAADEEAKGGKCLVNWKRICTPKAYGGLDIKDLQAFSRALRLRLNWLRWEDDDRLWKGLPTPCDDTDHALFVACTSIVVGNGKKAKFWEDAWLNGASPRQIGSAIFPLARRKNLSVSEAMSEDRWMKALQRINSDQFVQLWEKLQQVQLVDHPDTIRWKLTADEKYSATSAYFVQFYGRQTEPALEKVWKIRAEGKAKKNYGLCFRIITGQWIDCRREDGHMMKSAVCVV